MLYPNQSEIYPLHKKETLLFLILGSFFIANAIIAEFIGTKIFSLEDTIGIQRFQFSLFDNENLSLNLTAGVVLWPFVFILTDIINEYFGIRGVRLLSWIAVCLISWAFFAVFIAIHLIPADFWIHRTLPSGETINMNVAYNQVFGQGLWIIIGSLVAFLVGQLIDVIIFHKIKVLLGSKYIWIRATGSTMISQLIDSFVVLVIAFYFGANWNLSLVFAVGFMNYCFK
ncbi:MAG: queuosine precursor transporter, partial [Bacteroidia bacterium]|nr:queuosine precursor transporter [Bacteroidia bacterium]